MGHHCQCPAQVTTAIQCNTSNHQRNLYLYKMAGIQIRTVSICLFSILCVVMWFWLAQQTPVPLKSFGNGGLKNRICVRGVVWLRADASLHFSSVRKPQAASDHHPPRSVLFAVEKVAALLHKCCQKLPGERMFYEIYRIAIQSKPALKRCTKPRQPTCFMSAWGHIPSLRCTSSTVRRSDCVTCRWSARAMSRICACSCTGSIRVMAGDDDCQCLA